MGITFQADARLLYSGIKAGKGSEFFRMLKPIDGTNLSHKDGSQHLTDAGNGTEQIKKLMIGYTYRLVSQISYNFSEL